MGASGPSSQDWSSLNNDLPNSPGPSPTSFSIEGLSTMAGVAKAGSPFVKPGNSLLV